MTCLYCQGATRVVETKPRADWVQEERLCSRCGNRAFWRVAEGTRRLVCFGTRSAPETWAAGPMSFGERCDALLSTRGQRASKIRWVPPTKKEVKS